MLNWYRKDTKFSHCLSHSSVLLHFFLFVTSFIPSSFSRIFSYPTSFCALLTNLMFSILLFFIVLYPALFFVYTPTLSSSVYSYPAPSTFVSFHFISLCSVGCIHFSNLLRLCFNLYYTLLPYISPLFTILSTSFHFTKNSEKKEHFLNLYIYISFRFFLPIFVRYHFLSVSSITILLYLLLLFPHL